MSLLLDALNKADQERKRNEATPGINSNHENTINHGARNKTITIIASVAGVVILLVAIYWLGQRSATPTVVAITQASSVANPTQSQQNNPTASTPAPATQVQASSEQAVDTSEDNVANLYQQNAQAQNTNATLTLATPLTDVSAPASHTSNEQPTTAPTSIAQFANLPDLHDLPSQVLEKIPSLNYSEHNYNSNGGSVKINGNIQHANEQLAGGVVIDKILEDGMILHVDNYSFKMRALNSWINM